MAEKYRQFLDEYLLAPVKEFHVILANQEENGSLHNYAQYFANQEWTERQTREIAKIRSEAQELKDNVYKAATSTTLADTSSSSSATSTEHPQQQSKSIKEGIAPISFVKKVCPWKFERFRDSLITNQFILADTPTEKLRRIFGLNQDYHPKLAHTNVVEPVLWNGSAAALRIFFNELASQEFIKLDTPKWDKVCKCFINKRSTKVFTISEVETSSIKPHQKEYTLKKVQDVISELTK
jgi:hypothetical protein